jgi:hypothetical protein
MLELQLLAVVQVDLRPRDGRLLLLQMRRNFVLQVIEHRLDVLAGAERVGLEVRAGADVVPDLEAPDGNRVLPAGLRVGHPVVGEHAVLAQVLDLELDRLRPLPADVDLDLAEHGYSLARDSRVFGPELKLNVIVP